jgi:hypothetical protein
MGEGRGMKVSSIYEHSIYPLIHPLTEKYRNLMNEMKIVVCF